MIEFLGSLLTPAAAAGGVVFGAFVSHVWTRIRGRIVSLSWIHAVHRVAESAEESHFGSVSIQWNGTAVKNLFMVHVDVSNDSHADLGDFELQVGFRDGSLILGEAAEVRGSLAKLQLSPTYQGAVQQLAAADDTQNLSVLQTDLGQNRFFTVPSLTRGGTIGMSFLVHAETGVAPRPLVYCEAKGVKLREHPPKTQIFGVPQDAAALSGVVLGLIMILIASAWVDFSVGLVASTFIVGASATFLGVGAIYLKRWIARILG